MPSVNKPKKITMLSVWKSSDPNRKTQGLKGGNGLGKEDIMLNKRGRLVSKAASEKSQQNYKGSNLERWAKCVSQAKKDLGLAGFGGIAAGTPGYERAWEYWEGTRELEQ